MRDPAALARTIVRSARASLPWPQLVLLTSVPVLLVLLILTFLHPSWLLPQPSLFQALQSQHQESSSPQNGPRSTPKP